MNELRVYLNGEMVPASQARLPIYDAGIVQGATVTEQTRTFRHQPWRIEQHLDRLFHSLKLAGISIELTREELRSISLRLVTQNAKLIDPEDDLGLIQFITAGEYATYAAGMGRPARTSPTVCIHTFRLPFELWARKMREGVHLITPSIRQVPPECTPPHMKCRSRMHYFLAEQEVRQTDPQAWALLLDLQGHITETNAANFLMVEKGTIVSPRFSATLPGISRAFVCELAGKLGIQFEESDITVDGALKADEAFLTSTPWCIMPVTKLNGTVIGAGRRGAIFYRLLNAWSSAAGIDIARQIQSKA
ncbi:MAG TPA: aminotransferase class IV [Gemmataceae bacterium]|nr:aminotransferase class IV [Gemmataceae bacterium]